jgi:hypothetical protein
MHTFAPQFSLSAIGELGARDCFSKPDRYGGNLLGESDDRLRVRYHRSTELAANQINSRSFAAPRQLPARRERIDGP